MAELRGARSISQDELGRLVGAEQRDISNYERGKALPRIERLEEIAHALGVSLSDLFSERPPPTRRQPAEISRLFALVEKANKEDPRFASRLLRIVKILIG